MKKKKPQNYFPWLLGLIFFSPIIFSTRLLEMDNLQKLALSILALPLIIVLSKKKIEKEEYFVDSKLFIFIFLFPLTFLTAFINKSLDMLLLQLTYLVPPLFILFYTLFVFNNIGEETFFRISALSIVVVSTIFSSIGLLQVMGVELVPLPQIIIPGSTIGHRGFAVEFLLPAIPFLLILKNYVKKDYYPLLLFAGVINISFLLFTRSRSAFGISILIITAIIVRIIFQKNFKYKIQTLLPIIGVYLLAFLLSLIPPIKGERSDFGANVKTIADTEYKSNKLRMNFWQASVEMIKENPFTGVGLQKWSGIYPKYYGDEFTDSRIYFVHAIHSHNDFLELFAENGIAAPIIYTIIILLILYNLYKKSKSNENYFFILLSSLSIVGFSFVAFPFSKFSSYFFLAFAAGLSLVTVNNKTKVVSLSSNQLKYFLIILIAIGIITSYLRLISELSYVKAIEYKNGGDYKNMLTELENVNSILYPLDPSKQPVEFYRATALYRLNRLDQALIHSINSEKIAPFNPLVLHNTAAIYQSSKKFDNAIIYYEKMRELFPNYIDPQINLLIIYSETSQSKKAQQLFDELIKKDSLNPRLIPFKSKYSNQF
ncbi:MAG: O-antigen ligase family protein [Ignavibacterium sp.]|nr:O-antigen ligase family protein [Ignavibacterium sp.]